MSRTKKVVEESVTPQQLEDYAEIRYRDEMEQKPEPVDILPYTTNIWQAIANFQAEVPILIQNSTASKYTYVDLAEIVRVITPLLRKHKLAYIQPLTGKAEITTILFHTETGEQVKSTIEIPIIELDYMNLYQSIGSAITYYRRYSISSLLNLISEKDNDAQGTQKRVQKAPEPVGKKKLNDEELAEAIRMIDNNEYSLEKLQRNYYLTTEQMSHLRTYYGTKN